MIIKTHRICGGFYYWIASLRSKSFFFIERLREIYYITLCMKQDLIDFLNMDLQFIRGVGSVLASRFNDVIGGRRVLDFMLHIPRAVRNRGITECVMDATRRYDYGSITNQIT